MLRKPNREELEELAKWQAEWQFGNPTDEKLEEIEEWVNNPDICYAGVFDHYRTDCPGYAGRIMFIVWSGPCRLGEESIGCYSTTNEGFCRIGV